MMPAPFSFPGLQPVVRIVEAAGEIVTLLDRSSGATKFIRIVETNKTEGRQVLDLSDSGAFLHYRTVVLENEKPSPLWPDMHARFFFDSHRTTWRTCFFVLPSVKVNRQQQRRSQRDRDAAGANIQTGIGEIEGRRPVDKAARIVTSRSKIE